VTHGSLIRVAHRFRGPPQSANGGYICGCVARLATGTVRVRLLSAPPLDVVLHAIARDDDGFDLLHDGVLVATARRDVLPAGSAFDPQRFLAAPPDYEQALQASKHFIGFHAHPFVECFVCGPARARGDGLRIFAGPVAESPVGTPLYAAPWLPDESLAGSDGRVAAEYMWAALDCPGFAAASPDGRLMLLGEFTAHVDRLVHVDEPCVVLAWVLRRDGRKCEVATALLDEDGECCARARAVWVEPRQADA
jgi:hypothetical protein